MKPKKRVVKKIAVRLPSNQPSMVVEAIPLAVGGSRGLPVEKKVVKRVKKTPEVVYDKHAEKEHESEMKEAKSESDEEEKKEKKPRKPRVKKERTPEQIEKDKERMAALRAMKKKKE